MASLRERASRTRHVVRRTVLARRRLLAALLTAVAVTAGVNAVAAPPPERVPVLVAAQDLPGGAVLSAEDLVTAQFAPGSAPGNLVNDPVGRVLAAPLRRGEPVTDVRLLGAALTEGYPGVVALPVRLPDAGMVELLRVGDRIDLVAADPQGGTPQTVATGVPVLAVPDPTDAPGATGLPGRLVVIGAVAAEVPRITDAAVRLFLTYAYSG